MVLLTDLSNPCHYFPKSQTESALCSLSRKNRKLVMKQVCVVLQILTITVEHAAHHVFSSGLAMNLDEKSIRKQRKHSSSPCTIVFYNNPNQSITLFLETRTWNWPLLKEYFILWETITNTETGQRPFPFLLWLHCKSPRVYAELLRDPSPEALHCSFQKG